MGELADENSMIIVAADAMRSSFGCSYAHLHTWFTQAFFEALAQSGRFEQAYQLAAKTIQHRELEGEAYEHSMPQIHVGAAIRSKLAQIEERSTKASKWEPPNYATEEGKIAKQLLGDYVAVRGKGGSNPQVHWWQLKKIAATGNGNYQISAWGEQQYKLAGNFDGVFDSKSGAMTFDVPTVGKLRLVAKPDQLILKSGASPDLVFDKVPRREAIETKAKFAPVNLRAKESSAIRLVYISASDCAPCRAWERDHLDGGNLLKKPEFRDVEVVTAKRLSLKNRLRKGDLPEKIAHIYDKWDSQRDYERLLTRTPAFVVLINDEIRTWSTGQFLDSPIYPFLRAALREKKGMAELR